MRAFVAIRIPLDPSFEKAHARFRSLGGPVKAVDPGNFHLTLKFIGETSIPVPDLMASLEHASAGKHPFTLRPTISGAFPNWARPRVVWIGFGNDGPTIELAGSIDRSLNEELSLPREQRAYSSHLTLARVNGRTGSGELRSIADELLSSLQVTGYNILVDSFSLMSSTLTPKGPIYREIGTLPLRG